MGVRENSSGGNNHYFKVSGSGLLYQSSREPKEGFEEHINDKTGGVSYWRVFWNGIEGYLSDVSVREVEFNGVKAKYVSIKISDEDGNYFINVPLMTQKGGINNYVKSLVRYLPNIDLKRKVVINPAHARKGDQYAPGNFFISYARETPDGRDELIQQYYKNGQNGWPDRVESTDIMGNKKFDYTAQDAFAYQVLNKYIQSIKTDGVKPAQSASQNNVGEATTQTPPPSYQPQAQPQTPPPSYQQAPPQTAQAPSFGGQQQPPQYPPFGDEDDLPF
nr:MAG TPA: Single-strand binding protein-strand binding protein, DNA BINDING.8A [Caudoviricetes sp.]